MSDMRKVNFDIRNKKRIFAAFVILSFFMILLIFRFAWVQIVRGDDYKEKAVAQQTADIQIQPKRGKILDRNGKELAASSTSYKLWIRPADLRKEYSQQKREEIVQKLASTIQMDKDEIYKDFNSDGFLFVVKKGLDKDTADKIRAMNIEGLELSEEQSRIYPMGDFASIVLGSVNDDGVGRSGIELEYNDYLSGVAGRWVKDKDITGNTLSYGNQRKYDAEDGLNVQLTIDEMLQHYFEDAIKDAMKKYGAKKAWGMVLNPKTGEILAMCQFPSFDPNDPLKPGEMADQKAYKKMSSKQKSNYINGLWRNSSISDTYEPGSTFKLLVASAILDYGLVTPESKFTCNQYIEVNGVKLHCWSPKPHGTITVTEAVGVSCNPIHVQLALKMGTERFYNFLNVYGMTNKTGIDLPAEAMPQVAPKHNLNKVQLATMGFGQGIAVTPIQLLSAIGALGNDGIMMEPHILKSMTDSRGKTVKTFKPHEIRKIVSKDTSAEMKKIMFEEIDIYGGGLAKVAGYRMGGKTGTAQIANEKGGYKTDRVYGSFVCLAPIDDPQLATLIIMDIPAGQEGSGTAAPATAAFMEKALPYLNIPKGEVSEKEGESKYLYVPNVTGMSYKEAVGLLKSQNLSYEIRPAIGKEEKEEALDFKVQDQYPKAGKKIDKNGKVYIYRE